MSSLFFLSWLQGTETSCAALSLEASLIPGTAAASKESHETQNLVRPEVLPDFSPQPPELPAGFLPAVTADWPPWAGPGRWSRWCQKQWRWVAWPHAQGRGLHVRLSPHPSCSVSEGSPKQLPSSAFVCRSWSSPFMLCFSGFSKREEKVEFSLVSPREAELCGQQHPCEAKKENNLVLPSWV